MVGVKRRNNIDHIKRTNNKTASDTTPTKALPVTLLSGFLGSGKTTLLQYILQSEHGLRIAVIVNDIGAINVDANLIRGTHRLTKTEEKVVALQNGCICCTLRGDLLEELVRLAGKKLIHNSETAGYADLSTELAQFDYVIIESSGISEPEQVAETFDTRLAEQISVVGEGVDGLDASTIATLKRLKQAGGLEKFARLDTTVTVIDAFTILNDFETADLLSSRRDDVVPEDERTVSDLMVDQIEFADVVILNKTDMVDQKKIEAIRTLVYALNHRAKLLTTHHGKIDVRAIVNTGLFNLERAQTGYGWLQDLHAMTLREVNGRKAVTPKPETEEYNVRNFVYTRRRPFHPLRLFQLVHDKFVLQHPFEDEDEDEDEEMSEGDTDEGEDEDGESDDKMETEQEPDGANDMEIPDAEVILANKRAHPVFSRLFRSKGEYWLATRPDRVGEWSQAGAMLTLSGGRPWFCCIDRKEWETGNGEIDELVKHDIDSGGEWGDRRQELVFIGEALDHEKVEELLDACLLTDEEWEHWQSSMRDGAQMDAIFDDGFPEWPEEDQHDHDHGDHDHAH